jgi:hypothetical protein
VTKLDWTIFGQYGLGGIALGLLAYALKLFHDSYRENTKAIHSLTYVMEKQSVREQMFMDMIYPIAKDTNERVRIIENEVKK